MEKRPNPTASFSSFLSTGKPAEECGKIFFADEQCSVRELLRAFFQSSWRELQIAGESSSASETLEKCAESQPDLVVVDLFFSDMPATQLISQLLTTCPKTRILAYSRWMERDVVTRMISAGVHGIVAKESTLENLCVALKAVFNGGYYFDSRLNGFFHQSHSELTDRELQVLCLIARGHLTKEIADQLSISVKTADKYRERIMVKLHLHDAVKLTHYALRNGLISLDRCEESSAAGRNPLKVF